MSAEALPRVREWKREPWPDGFPACPDDYADAIAERWEDNLLEAAREVAESE